MYRKGSPLRGTGVEVAVVDVEVASADGLWPEAVEQCDFRTGRDADYAKNTSSWTTAEQIA